MDEESPDRSPVALATDLSRTASGRLVRGFQRQLSVDWQRLLDQPLMCAICLEHYSAAERFVFSACQHSFCRECASGYLVHAITERESFPVVCPGFGCSAEVNPIDWKIAGCTAAQLDALDRWGLEHALMKGDGTEQWRACRGLDCQNGVLWSPESPARWTCESCGEVSCLACRAPWHEGLSCAGYMAQQAVGEQEGLGALISAGVVRGCPHCGVPTSRTEGCNHITCKACSGTWFWGQNASAAEDGLYRASAGKWSERARSLMLLSCSAGLVHRYGGQLFSEGSWWLQPTPVAAVAQAIQMVAESTVRGIGVMQWPVLTTHGFVIPIIWSCLQGSLWGTDWLMALADSYLIPSWLDWVLWWRRPAYEMAKGGVSLSAALCCMCFGITEASMVLPNKLKQYFTN